MIEFKPNVLLQNSNLNDMIFKKEGLNSGEIEKCAEVTNENFFNKMMKKTIIFTILLAVGFFSYAQQEETYSQSKKDFKVALDHLREGDALMNANMFNDALANYAEAYKYNANNAELNYNMGVCYLNTSQKFKALDHFKKAYAINPKVSSDIHYFLGRGYQLNMDWDNALEHYSQYKKDKKIGDKMAADANMNVVKRIKECESGKKLTASPQPYKIQNMGSRLNSPYSDYGMILNADASEVFFTSRRPAKKEVKGNDNYVDPDSYEGIYTSNRHSSSEWSPATKINIPTQLKSHDAPVALNPDGSKMIIYMDDFGNGNLYESVRDGDKWSEPKPFNEQINSPYHESSAWYSPDGKQLYFVSNRPVKAGDPAKDRDIFVATWDETRKDWINIKRLPETINSEYDEDGIYVHPDGRTIYFSSKGHNSMGGFDVFRSTIQSDGSWSTPENLGFPINTPDDDVFFTVAANGKDGYITSYRADGLGEKDLYLVTEVDKYEAPKTDDADLASDDQSESDGTRTGDKTKSVYGLTILKGIITDSKTKEPLRSDIELVDNETGEIVATFGSNSKSGRYLIVLPSGKNYGISASSRNYLFYSDNFDLKSSEGYQEVELDIELQRLDDKDITPSEKGDDDVISSDTETSSSITLKNIFYDFNMYTLRPESKTELNRVVKFMKEYPEVRIKISSHTDTRGTDDYNQRLSENRAKSVVNYLSANGISKNRLVYQGYGESKPVVSDSEIERLTDEDAIEAAHQKNRRTEFGILKR